MYNTFTFFTLALLLCGGMVGCVLIGHRIGQRYRAREGDAALSGTSGIEGAILALLGLLVAFTFSGAASRFDARRTLIVEEVNDIGTAWLRLDLVEAADQPALRDLFREYADARLAVYRAVGDDAAVAFALDAAAHLQGEIWKKAVAAVRRSRSPSAGMLLLPALNAMFDIATTRTSAAEMHPPLVVFAMLFAIALTSALMAGFGMSASRGLNRLHTLGFAVAIASVFYVIVDLEYPRLGLLRVEAFDSYFVALRQMMQ